MVYSAIQRTNGGWSTYSSLLHHESSEEYQRDRESPVLVIVSKTKLFLLGLLVSASLARAQEIIALDEVIITDNKLELPRAKKTKRVIRLGSKELQYRTFFRKNVRAR